MEEYLKDLPPSMGWFLGGNYNKVHHLVTEEQAGGYLTFCNRVIYWPITTYQVVSEWFDIPLCKHCRRRIDAWRRARDAEPQWKST